jgi:hypothetical protein
MKAIKTEIKLFFKKKEKKNRKKKGKKDCYFSQFKITIH